MTAVSWPSHLRASPELFPIDLHPGLDVVALVPVSRVDYEKASFLDTRLERRPIATPPFAEVEAACAGLPIACDHIFHIGHVGSTLLSRLLGTHRRVFSLREPLALRTLAQVQADRSPWPPAELTRRLSALLALYSRTWTQEQRALVKATSLVSEMAGAMLDLEAGSRAIFMTVTPETYLATILSGPNSRVELKMAAPARLARLSRRLGAPLARLETLSEGELAAMSWACETSALAAVAAANPGRGLWMDFDRFLEDPSAGLSQLLIHLHGSAAPDDVERLAGSTYFDRYSKAPEFGYGPAVRRETLQAARQDFAAEIRRGMAWLDAARSAGPLGPALEILGTPNVA